MNFGEMQCDCLESNQFPENALLRLFRVIGRHIYLMHFTSELKTSIAFLFKNENQVRVCIFIVRA